MSVWPYLPVWPILLIFAGLCGLRNVPAAMAFAACVILVRAVFYFELNNQLIWVIAIYSTAAFAVFYYVDKVAGGFFALVSLVLGLCLFGFLSLRFSLIATEAVLIAGMVASVYIGPSGGYGGPVRFAGSADPVRVVPQNIQADREGD